MVTKKKQRTHQCYLYVMSVEGGPTKIGQSIELERRQKTLEYQIGKELMLNGFCPVDSMVALCAERYAHWLLRDKHFRGEWFNVTKEEAIAAIELAVTKQYDRSYPIPPVDKTARELRGGEYLTTRFPAGTRDKIASLIGPIGDRATFMRAAIANEIDRRERTAAKPKP